MSKVKKKISSSPVSKVTDIVMRKKGSPLGLRIFPDPADPHFSNVELRRLKAGTVAANHYILTSDREQWVGMYRVDGYVIVEEVAESR